MNVICKFVIGYFLGIYFFLTLQRIVEKLLPFYIFSVLIETLWNVK